MAGKAIEQGTVRVLVADASSYARLVLTDMLGRLPGMSVVGTAVSGSDLMRQARTLRPQVVLMDADLPQNTRLFALQRLSSEWPVPVVLMTGSGKKLTETDKERMSQMGVTGFIEKPANILQPQLRSICEELHRKLMASAQQSDRPAAPVPSESKLRLPLHGHHPKAVMHLNPAKLIVLGASTGGTRQVEMLVQWLPANFKGTLLVAIHLPETFCHTFVKRLKSLTPISVSLASSGMLLEAGCILVAPGGRDMVLKEVPARPGIARVLLSDSSRSAYDSPSINLLMGSAAAIFGSDTIGVILTGMGSDGAKGMSAIAQAGGKTIVQDQTNTGVFGMVKSALRTGIEHQVLSLPQIASFIEHELDTDFGRQDANQRTSS